MIAVGGFDPTGRAGLAADLATIRAHGLHAAPVTATLTVQNRHGVQAVEPVGQPFVAAQLRAVFTDSALAVRAVKSGLLGSQGALQALVEALRQFPAAFVCDPVMVAGTGEPLIPDSVAQALLDTLVPAATLLVPNALEAGRLAGLPVRSPRDAERAGARLLERGARAVLVKGGHFEVARGTDVLVTREASWRLPPLGPSAPEARGTGCRLASAVAARLALGLGLHDAVAAAREFVADYRERVAHAKRVGRLHVITDETLQSRFTHVELARLAAEGGADVVQFREKRPRSARQRIAVARSMRRVLDGTAARLVVNDHVDVALGAGVSAVHLGPEDPEPEAARRALGPWCTVGATANDYDAAVRLAPRVDYLGVGPVFSTRSKERPAPALGLEGLARIAAAVAPVPVIAIGGITVSRVAQVLQTGAHGVAVLSAFVGAADPRAAVLALREAVERSVAGGAALRER